MAKKKSPVIRCIIQRESECGGVACQRCGWYPPEIERRRTLPLVPGNRGLMHKFVGKEKTNDSEQAVS